MIKFYVCLFENFVASLSSWCFKSVYRQYAYWYVDNFHEADDVRGFINGDLDESDGGKVNAELNQAVNEEIHV